MDCTQNKKKCQSLTEKLRKIFNKKKKESSEDEKATKGTNERIQMITEHILANSSHRPKIGIICGSGLGGLADLLAKAEILPYDKIPGFPRSTVVGHAGRLLFGELSSVPVVIMQGRFHAYEGYSMEMTTLPVRVMKLLGVQSLVVTNAAGAINDNFRVGDIMVIKDHINLPGLTGQHPLIGPNNDQFGPRFFSTTDMYLQEYRDIAKTVSRSLELSCEVHEGVYVMQTGPSYETVAELKMMELLGADTVGMSTVPETLVAHHCGMKVFAFSLVTNITIKQYNMGLTVNHEEVIATANRQTHDLKNFTTKMILEISKTID